MSNERVFIVPTEDRVFEVTLEGGIMLGAILKSPDAVLDFGVDWTAWLKDKGDTIDTVTWTLPDGVTMESGSDATDGQVATLKLQEGTVGESYVVECQIVTSNGLTDARSFQVMVEER